MNKDKALKMCLEYIETDAHERKYVRHAIKEALAEPEPNYKKALEVWLEKTEWVQKTVKPHELGMHRADVLKQRIKEVLAQPKQDSYYGYKGKCNRLMSDGNPCGLNAPCPDCGLSLIDCPQPQPWEKFCDSNCVWTDHHPDCKLAQPEPVAWMHKMDNTEGIKANGTGIVSITKKRKHPFGKAGVDFSKSYPITSTPLYTTPPQRKPLTDEEILAANYPDGEENGPTIAEPDFELICFARQIEAAHGIKE